MLLLLRSKTSILRFFCVERSIPSPPPSFSPNPNRPLFYLSFDPAAPFGGSRETTSALRHKTASQTISKDAVNGTVKRTGTATSRPRMETTPPPGLTADDEANDDAGCSRAPRMAEKPKPESSSLRSGDGASDEGMKGGKQRGKLWVFLLGYLISGFKIGEQCELN